MSESLLTHSMFYEVLFPPKVVTEDKKIDLKLRRGIRYSVPPRVKLHEWPLVVFDFETTGLDISRDYIIELGAQKIIGHKVVDQISTFVACEIPLPEVITNITGITDEMLKGQPALPTVLNKFLKFIDGAILVAHNAVFDVGFLKEACSRLSIDLECPAFCTLKMARELLPDLERKNLDSLAEHFGLKFESRHRSIGDVKVTVDVMHAMLQKRGAHLQLWEDMKPFAVE